MSKKLYKIEKLFSRKEYSEEEKEMIKSIFGILPSNVYFYTKLNITIKDDEKFYNIYGLSGDGKTVIKNELKNQLIDDYNVLDYDDDEISSFIQKNKKNNIMTAFNITSSDNKLMKMLSYFGFFEMRLLYENIENLSNGQQTRLKYIYLVHCAINSDKKCFIIIDEFLTFVDSLSGISFARGLTKFLSSYNNIKLFTFGVNDSLVGQFEDKTYGLSNGRISFKVTRKNNEYEMMYMDNDVSKDTKYFKDNLKKFKINKTTKSEKTKKTNDYF